MAMHVEEYSDKDERNERFNKLREQGTPDVTKFSTVKDNQSVWCVAFGGR